ncbi:hypothetical protein BDU57DRAFT_559256 [Ampelomyces quisqualis]|uniref:Nephrocystin 3-like N-terminal domain-containing protein n=1 Tax=Ampelomyces quisqualis TaxID=50730 RepID=A0A6A5QCR0_AMPQU|nr:hypothetical protein BDU57DRAFT_559256 [Ampelomyces quisqualis]
MDPLSVVASIVAILQLSAKVIGYLNHVKDTSKDRATCAVEASNLHSLLTNLRFRLEDEDVATPWFTAIRALAVENGPLDQFQHSLELLHHRMTGAKGRVGKITQALTWKFNKEEIDSILHSIERLKTMVDCRKVATSLMMQSKLSQAIKNDTEYVRGRLPRIQTAIETVHLEQERAALEDLRSWLSQTNPAAQQSDILRRRHKGTGQWFLDAPEFTAWLRGASASGALFCTGIPGAGKTMIAALAIEHLATSVRSDTVGVAWAYCSYKSQNEQTVGALLATLLQQLLQAANPSGVQVVERLREKHTARGTMPHVDELLGTLQVLVAELSTTFIVIDAMDECSASDGTRMQFLAHLRTLQINADTRLMVTSRHVPEIVDDFKLATRLEIRAHTEDIEKFLAGQLARLPRCIQRDAVLQQLVQTKITEAIDGM